MMLMRSLGLFLWLYTYYFRQFFFLKKWKDMSFNLQTDKCLWAESLADAVT